MNEKKVSIITPCYNGEKFIERYLKSILEQTYKNIELIVVNDGSTDNSEKIILKYKNIFFKKNMELIYIYQSNKGLGGAINTGLKYFTGDYLCWADCDDIFFKESIERRVKYLECNKQYGCVSSDAYIYIEKNLNKPIGKVSENAKHNFDEYQFIHHLKGESIFCSGCHMIRSEVFLDVNPSREIYQAKRGQNWQMLLPVYYKYKRGFIDEPLYKYIVYNNSMSSGDNTKEKVIKRYNEHLSIIKNTLERINMGKKEKRNYLKIFDRVYIRDIFNAAIKYEDIKLSISKYLIIIAKGYKKKYDTRLVLNLFKKKIL